MKVHHLSCGCFCPPGSHLFPCLAPRKLVCHCLLIETSNRLILVDSGFSKRDLENPKRLGPMAPLMGTDRDLRQTSYEQVRLAGFSPADVTDLMPTHLDLDHAGGINDFPKARVHVSHAEFRAATSPTTFKMRGRYEFIRFDHDVKWQLYSEQAGTEWNGFACARELNDLPSEIVAVQLPGHTPGHFGIGVHENGRWMLHAGDAYYDRRELAGTPVPLGLSLLSRLAHTDYDLAKQTQKKLASLKDVHVFSAHDPKEFEDACEASRSIQS